ncbi:MAG TPA: hypothetical protein VNS31_08260 [Ramlibacter sp.]|nr:hypothetical protein [Ramlibacter sp.]
MKSLAAALALACLAAAAAPEQEQEQPPPRPAPDLRQAVQQYDAGSGAAPRRLTAVERAELRRQLSEQARPARPLKQRKEP